MYCVLVSVGFLILDASRDAAIVTNDKTILRYKSTLDFILERALQKDTKFYFHVSLSRNLISLFGSYANNHWVLSSTPLQACIYTDQ